MFLIKFLKCIIEHRLSEKYFWLTKELSHHQSFDTNHLHHHLMEEDDLHSQYFAYDH